MDIYDLIKNEDRISFIGMCKNAGKTTVLNEVIKSVHNRGENILLTPTYKRAGIAFTIISTGGFSTTIITTLEKHATTKN